MLEVREYGGHHDDDGVPAGAGEAAVAPLICLLVWAGCSVLMVLFGAWLAS
jgi:hypothetical protein